MYKSYKLLTMTVNIKGGENETIEHLYKEVDGKLVPMNEAEAIFKMAKDFSTIGGNASVHAIKCILINPSGLIHKSNEYIKPSEPTVTE